MIANKLTDQDLEKALQIFFSKSTVPVKNWSKELKDSYKQDLIKTFNYLTIMKADKE